MSFPIAEPAVLGWGILLRARRTVTIAAMFLWPGWRNVPAARLRLFPLHPIAFTHAALPSLLSRLRLRLSLLLLWLRLRRLLHPTAVAHPPLHLPLLLLGLGLGLCLLRLRGRSRLRLRLRLRLTTLPALFPTPLLCNAG